MTQEKARAFLEKLATDDDFRKQVEQDPVATLAEYGIAVKAEDLPAAGVRLPSSEEIQKNLDTMSQQLEATSGEIFFAL
ncbi:MAG TPA: NHLP-related RiPP peptide [Xanthomonadaceae bacterium]|nr:NHLP-related RiPP peptide [Xanthomonadaceae bacterium]